MPARTNSEQQRTYFAARASGIGKVAAARLANVSPTTARGWERGVKNSSGDAGREQAAVDDLPDVIPRHRLKRVAAEALEDFGLFRLRYFGRRASPWQEEAAYLARDLLESDQKEFLVVNCPPGSGKSTLFTHDIPAWVACRDRSIRCLIGSRTQTQARMYTRRLRNTFDRQRPALGRTDEVAKGLSFDAKSTLVADYGRFRPQRSDLWRVEEFVIAQLNDDPSADKEASFAAYGMDSGFLGGRYTFVNWDDLVDKTTMRTAEARELQRDWWDTEAETRLEPGGLLILQGQRMGAEDLYRYALDKVDGGLSTEVEYDEAAEQQRADRQYKHVIFRAHYEEDCKGPEGHARDADAYPAGCLLDPLRLPWRELQMRSRNNQEKFRVLYQQEDVDPASVLVPMLWIKGGKGADGHDYPGCEDKDRQLCELPKGIDRSELVSVATADPSPTKYWSIQWWIYDPKTEQRFLMDLIRQSMDAPDFLDWNNNTQEFSGVMQEWQDRSEDLSLPIKTWVVEANAAQRFIMQFDHFKRWQRKTGVNVIPHQTHRNKADPDFGVQTLAPHYRFGRVRLPRSQGSEARIRSQKLIDEVTRWPEGATDDCVMAQWFLEYQLPNIYVRRNPAGVRVWRPSWMK